jgi:hypothetical protein
MISSGANLSMEDCMAKRTSLSNSRRGRRAQGVLSESTLTSVRKSVAGYNYKGMLRKFTGNKLLMNAGIGIGSYFLVRTAIKFYKAHPEISEFITENLNTVESKMKEYHTSVAGNQNEDLADARH